MFAKKEVTRKVATILVLVLTLIACYGTNTTAKAYQEGEEIARFLYADGITRCLIAEGNDMYCNDFDDSKIYVLHKMKEVGFDKYGTIWCTEKSEDEGGEKLLVCIIFYNPYERSSSSLYFVHRIPYYLEDDGGSYFFDVDCLKYDENNKVIGFKTTFGEEYDTLDLEKQKTLVQNMDDYELPYVKDYSTYIPEGYVAPTPTPTSDVTPTPTPTASSSNETATQTPASSQVVTPSPTSKVNNSQDTEKKNSSSGTVESETTKVVSTKVSIKTEKGYKVYYKGDNAVGKYKLKKGVLTYNGKKYKKVKKTYFIKNSGSLVYLDSKKRAYLLKGKKKKLLMKGAKKIITSGGFATKVKGKNKTISVKNK